MNEIWFMWLLWASWTDWRKREISVWFFGLAAICGLVIGSCLADSLLWYFWQTAKSMMIGVVLLACSWLTEGAIGSGDGWWFLISGCYLGWEENLWCFAMGNALSGLYSIGVMIWGKWKGVSVWKKGYRFCPFYCRSVSGFFLRAQAELQQQCRGIAGHGNSFTGNGFFSPFFL